MPLPLYAFRYRSPVTGKGVKARYVAELQEIRDHYAEFELIGEPEVRETNVLWTGRRSRAWLERRTADVRLRGQRTLTAAFFMTASHSPNAVA
jgi:hypothetical protein